MRPPIKLILIIRQNNIINIPLFLVLLYYNIIKLGSLDIMV